MSLIALTALSMAALPVWGLIYAVLDLIAPHLK